MPIIDADERLSRLRSLRDRIDAEISSIEAVQQSRRRRERERQATVQEVRDWAVDAGYAIGRRGRLPMYVIDAYLADHRDKALVVA